MDASLATVTQGDGEALLWIHGYTLSAAIWGEVWAELPGWRHVGVDLPGHGASLPLAPGDTLPGLAGRLLAVAEEHDARHVVALSFGGMIALQMAIEAPDAVATLTLSSPALGGGPDDPHAVRRNRELARLYRERGPGPWLTEAWMAWPPDIFRGAHGHPELWSALRSTIDAHRWTELGDGRLRGLTGDRGQIRQLGRIRAAVLVLVGEDDMPAFARTAELLRRGVARCERVRVPGAGHLSLLERPSFAAPLVDAHARSGSAVPR